MGGIEGSNFNPRAPCGARRLFYQKQNGGLIFQPTRPLRGATCAAPTARRPPWYFNPRAPCGARRRRSRGCPRNRRFQPTRPLRGATGCYISQNNVWRISTHAPLAGRDWRGGATVSTSRSISTHAPLAGRDVDSPAQTSVSGISTHAPLAGRDTDAARLLAVPWYFNPRAPCGARRVSPYGRCQRECNFNPRAPCGARRSLHRIRSNKHQISTHAPLAGRDAWRSCRDSFLKSFQPTRPLRGATQERQALITSTLFQPTRPLRGATITSAPAPLALLFQPTRPLRGATPRKKCTRYFYFIFQPTRPLRGATVSHHAIHSLSVVFQPTRPLRGATRR